MSEHSEAARMNGTSPSAGSATVLVVDIIPLWRWAVGPTSQHSPAIPYYTRTKAEAFCEEAKRDLPSMRWKIGEANSTRMGDWVREYWGKAEADAVADELAAAVSSPEHAPPPQSWDGFVPRDPEGCDAKGAV